MKDLKNRVYKGSWPASLSPSSWVSYIG